MSSIANGNALCTTHHYQQEALNGICTNNVAVSISTYPTAEGIAIVTKFHHFTMFYMVGWILLIEVICSSIDQCTLQVRKLTLWHLLVHACKN